MCTSSAIPTSDRSIPLELSPLDIIALEAALDPFCPVASAGGQYRPELCLPWCSVCRDLLRERGGPCGKNGSPTSPTR